MEKVYGICENKCRMEVVPKSAQLTATIGTAWNGETAPYTQTIKADGVEAESVIEVFLPATATAEQAEAFGALALQGGSQSDGSFVLRAFGEKNTINIPINLIIRRDI